MFGDATGGLLAHSITKGSQSSGFNVGSGGYRIVASTARMSARDGFRISGDDNTLHRNKAVASGFDGIFVNSGAANTMLSRNVVLKPNSDGIDARGTSTTIRRNIVKAAGFDGIFVPGSAVDTLVDRNFVLKSAGGGIDFRSGTGTISDNLAVRNTDWGIISTFAGRDGGGNRAFGNGQPSQCSNVSC